MITEKEKTRTITEKIFVTSDGKEFTYKRDAEKHEVELMPEKQIPTDYIELLTTEDYGYCYKIKSEDDLKYLQQKIWLRNAYYHYDGPGWYIAIRHDGGDYPDSYDVFSVKRYLSLLESDVNTLKKIEEEIFDF
jgi:hypothetical protein